MKFNPINLFKKEPKKIYIQGQTREGWKSGMFSGFNVEIPFQHNMGLYNTLRSTLPFIDGLSGKINRLLGSFRFETYGNQSVLDSLELFRKEVPINVFSKGWHIAQYQIVDNASMMGHDVMEMVIEPSNNGINRLQLTNPETFVFVKKEDGGLVLAQNQELGNPKILDMTNIFYTAFDKRMGHPQGYSMLYSLPFVTQILNRIYKSIDNTMWRIGDPSFLVTIEGGANTNNKALQDAATSFTGQFKTLFSKRRTGQPYDLVTGVPEGSKIKLDIVGGDGKFIDGLEFVIKNMIEQCVSAWPFPLWMYNLQWTSRQSLAKHENDMVVAYIKWIRSILDPVIERVFSTHLITTGKATAKWKHKWNEVNLLDEKEQATARKENAIAIVNEIRALQNMIELGMNPDEVAEYMEQYNVKTKPEWWDEAVKDARALRAINRIKAFRVPGESI